MWLVWALCWCCCSMQDEDQQTITVEVEVEGRYDSEPTLVAPQVSPEIRYALQIEHLPAQSWPLTYKHTKKLIFKITQVWRYWQSLFKCAVAESGACGLKSRGIVGLENWTCATFSWAHLVGKQHHGNWHRATEANRKHLITLAQGAQMSLC